VDLDGTLIKTDLLWESLVRLLCRNPFQLLPVFVLVDARPGVFEAATQPTRHG